MKAYILSLAVCMSLGLISLNLYASPTPVSHGKNVIFEKAGFSNSSHMLKLAALPPKQAQQAKARQK